MMTTATSSPSVVATLNKQVANWSVLHVKLHNYHWFVKGPHFFTLHGKFEELYKQASDYIDRLAERVLALKGRPPASLKEYLDTSAIKDAKGFENANQMVENLIDDFYVLINETKSGINEAEENGDPATADLLIEVKSAMEKHVWMLSSFLG